VVLRRNDAVRGGALAGDVAGGREMLVGEDEGEGERGGLDALAREEEGQVGVRKGDGHVQIDEFAAFILHGCLMWRIWWMVRM